MPRKARLKDSTSIYHVMVKGNSDSPIFGDKENKCAFLGFVKKYKNIFLFKVYGYCVMDTHAHFIIDSNGSDISKFMHIINQCYAQYFNKKNSRFGHVFGDRFKSKIVTDDRYLLTLSAYIHSNPQDLTEFSNQIEKYPFSSLGSYIGENNDPFHILDPSFILNMFSINHYSAKQQYKSFMGLCSFSENDILEFEFKNEKSNYVSGRTILPRNFSFNQIMSFVESYSHIISNNVYFKYKHRTKQIRSLSILLAHSLCNFTYKELCSMIGNITVSQASRLSYDALSSILQNSTSDFSKIVFDLIEYTTVLNKEA